MILNFLSMLLGKEVILSKPENSPKPSASFFNLEAKTIEGEKFHFSQLKGKKTIIVNTASNCGFTPQFTLLEDFHRLYNQKINVLGFPCNDFLGQEPGESSQIKNFCVKEFNISFPLFQKITLHKNNRSPIFEWLTNKNLNGWNSKKPDWNFCKYLIDEEGELLLFANSRITPTHPDIIDKVEH